MSTPTVSKTILLVVGAALLIMELSAVTYRAVLDWRDIGRHAQQRGTVALNLLEVLHTQTVANRRSNEITDPAALIFDSVLDGYTRANKDVRLWMTGPNVPAPQPGEGPNVKSVPPRDEIDRIVVAKKHAAEGVVDGWFRMSRPSVGQGDPTDAPTQEIGVYSFSIDLHRPRQLWISHVLGQSLTAMAIVLSLLGVVAWLLNRTTLTPLRRLALATQGLAAGNLSVKIENAERRDELGTLARSLEVFRNNLLEKRQAEDKIAHLALHDALTGLPNRASLHRILAQAVVESPSGIRIAVASMDLDDFKQVNDLHGQSAGDGVLKAVSSKLVMVTGEGEFVSRVGGDEFVAFKRFKAQAELFDFVTRLRSALQVDIAGAGDGGSSSAHIGVAIWPDDATTTDALLAKADNALQRAKSDTTRYVCYYEATLDEAARRRRQIVAALPGAAERGELFLNFQVQKSLKDLKTTGYEALLRWLNPELGLVSPAEFIPIAEQCGAITGVGEWVLREACREAARWPAQHKVAVNISPIQLAGQTLQEVLRDVLAETRLDPQRLELEITETAIIGDRHEALDTLRRIKALGVSIALDDFGRGYSSLETLRSFPFDKIKLDRFFVTELVGSAEARAIIRAIVALGNSLSIQVLAEGIETEEQLGVLRREGCCEGQGFLFGRPQRFVDMEESARHAS